MRRVWQVAAFFLLSPVLVRGADLVWKPLTIQKSIFTEQVGLLDTEREDYAGQLAAYAGECITREKGSQEALTQGRKVLALALQLSPRNKQAMVLNFQLAKGILPEAESSDMGTEALAKLLFARAEQLKKQSGEENQLLARIFTQLAAEMDPKNVDVVYASEINRLDFGPIDWNALIQPSA